MADMKAIGALVLFVVAHSAAPAQTARIVGTVMRDSSGHALGAAEVALPDLKRSTSTNYLGEFRISGLPAGRHAILIRHVGFAALVDTITVADGARLDLEFTLREAPVQLDSMRITAPEKRYLSPGLQQFEERRKEGLGRFISEEQLRKNDDRSLLDVLSSFLPGTRRYRPDPRNPGAYYISSSRKCGDGPVILGCRGGTQCPITLYVDGVIVLDAAAEKDGRFYPDLTKYPTNQYAGVEYYPGGATVPAKYNMSGSGCGVLLLWTRER